MDVEKKDIYVTNNFVQVEAVKKFLSDHRVDIGLSVESSGVFMRIPWDEKTRATVQLSEDSLDTLAAAYLDAHVEMARYNVFLFILNLFYSV